MIDLFSGFEMVINIGAIVILAICLFGGFKDGFVLSLFDLVSFIIVIFVAYSASGTMATIFPLVPESLLGVLSLTNDPMLDAMINTVIHYLINLLVWFIILMLVLKLLTFFIRPFLKSFKKLPILGKFNSLFGGVIGLVKAYLLVLLMGWVISLPVFSNGTSMVENSVIAPINTISKEVFTSLNQAYDISGIIKDASQGISEFAELSQEQIDQLIIDAANKMQEGR